MDRFMDLGGVRACGAVSARSGERACWTKLDGQEGVGGLRSVCCVRVGPDTGQCCCVSEDMSTPLPKFDLLPLARSCPIKWADPEPGRPPSTPIVAGQWAL
jgi:hypothetical protein